MMSVDKRLEQKINEKIQETLANISEINQIARSLDQKRMNSEDFKYGIIIGRLYNSFYYQSRRVLKRDPTKEEFSEFLEILNKKQPEILKSI
jgi:preprotein translocase subunit Sss1